MSGAQQYFDAHRDLYEHGPLDGLHKHLAGWRGAADVPVLLFFLLHELRSLRAELANSSRCRKGRKSKVHA